MPATPNPTAAPPAAAPTHSSEWRALLLTDVVDSTQLSQALGDERMAALWNDHDRAARDLLLPRLISTLNCAADHTHRAGRSMSHDQGLVTRAARLPCRRCAHCC